MKNISKKLIIASAITLGLTSMAPLTSSVSAEPARVVISTQYLSVSQVKAMASFMRTSTGAPAIISATALGGLLSKVPYASVVIMAASLAANANSRAEVIYAADNNMRVKAVTTDYADYHTSYSQVTTFTPVK
ncbi:hypothetical protein PaeCFBP13512_15785 [Paenibacillus sp. CFBP13512]|uniref:hypothetical protein n=1 Tax=Paenibacillus sp. CFBP13512 TaxID=2184007 RepID=UPI0010C016DD|nr:hypothetical protein [Paenibacillus sp. CFBP13512]TKJ89120.1 hypothetical protein PaeCFBP13512_15785 [Paenibacillus sp. CFBP13512]